MRNLGLSRLPTGLTYLPNDLTGSPIERPQSPHYIFRFKLTPLTRKEIWEMVERLWEALIVVP